MSKIFGKPFQPGQSGNPRGRPKMTRQQRIGKLMDQVLKDKLRENDGLIAEAIAVKLIQQARKGSLKAIELILERTQGKATQTFNIHDDDEPKTVKDIEQRIAELLRRAAARKDDSGGEESTPGVAGDTGKDPRVQ